jgi:hemolysin activation/secretion protein
MSALCHVRTALVATLAWGVVAAPSFAQSSAATGVPTREEIDRPDLRPTAAPPARLTVEGDIERAPCPLADPQYANITFTLSDVVFNNLAGIDAAELRPAFAEFLGRTVPLATVCEIRDRAGTILRRRGYLAAVQVPPQEIEGGTVRFDVLMARIVSVQVRGDAGRSERTIAGFLQALTDMPVFNEREAERYLLLARDLPGYDVRLTLRPAGAAPGQVIGEVTVLHQPIEVDFSAQNYGGRDVGRFGGQLRAQFNGLTGLGDRTTLGVYTTADFEEQQVVQLFHDFGIGSEGLRLAGRVTHAWTQPGGAETADLDIKSRTLLASVEATYPFVRSQSMNVYGAIGLDFVNQEVDILGETLNRDKLRVLYARADFDSIDPDSLGALPGYTAFAPRWRLGGSLEVRQGLGILDATDFCATCDVQPSRVPGTSRGTVVRGAAIVEYRPLPDIAFSLSPRVQLSDDALFAYEEFSAGNYTAGRGYDPGALVGDSGFGFQSELRYGSGNPQARDGFAFQPYAFFDAAWVSNRRDAMDGTESLFSAGAGVRAAFGDRARLDLTVAVPLKRLDFQAERPDPRLLLTFSTRLVPWAR